MDFDWGHFADVPLDEKIYVRQDDEGRSQRRPGVVLHDQIVTLELPVDVAVGLHFREGVAGAHKREPNVYMSVWLQMRQNNGTLISSLPTWT